MFLVIGHSSLAIELARWCSKRRLTRIVGLASKMGIVEDVGECEVLPLPSQMLAAELPDSGHHPTAVILVDAEVLSDSVPLIALRGRWPDVPLLTTENEGIDDSVDGIDTDEIIAAAYREKIRSWERHAGAKVLETYLKGLSKESKVAIFCHDNPDPDALASALAMEAVCRSIGHIPTIYHGGLIEHQQNQAMVRLLEIPLRRIILDWELDDVLNEADCIVTVDFHQPGANNVLPEECVPHIIIDHHASDKPVSADVAFLRPEYSATSSLIANLLMNMSVDMTPRLATALSFGIRTDTLSFTRSFNPVDLRALMWLNTWVDSELLASIEAPLKSQDTLHTFTQALASKKHEGSLILAPISSLKSRDDLSQVADFLFATKETEVVVVYGIQRNRVLLSARSRRENLHLGLALSKHFSDGQAGGHKGLAGGQILFETLGFEEFADAEMKGNELLETMAQHLQAIFAQEDSA
jgi:nanoRNase/pAp phosphatase (c-di-AMP/oligoRNAs hydrolase)